MSVASVDAALASAARSKAETVRLVTSQKLTPVVATPETEVVGTGIAFSRLARACMFLGSVLVLFAHVNVVENVGLRAQQSAVQQRRYTVNQPLPSYLPVEYRSIDAPIFVIYGNIELYWSKYVVKEFYWVIQNLTARGWRRKVLAESEHSAVDLQLLGEDMVLDFGRPPDVLLFLQDVAWLQPRNPNHVLFNTAILCWYDDTPAHYRGGKQLANADVLFPTYEHLIDGRVVEAVNVSRVWIPHSAMQAFILPLNPSPNAHAVLLVGSIDPNGYPLRWYIYQKMKGGDKRFEQWEHPGWQPGRTDHQSQMANAVRGYLAAICDATSASFVVGKVFEIPAVGTLLLMTDDIVQPMEALGFVDGVHYKSYNKATLDSVVQWVFDPANRAEIDRMRAAGQEVAWTRHQTYMRAETIHDTALAVKQQGGRRRKKWWNLPKPFNMSRDYGGWTPYRPTRPDKLARQNRMRGLRSDVAAGDSVTNAESSLDVWREKNKYDELMGLPRVTVVQSRNARVVPSALRALITIERDAD